MTAGAEVVELPKRSRFVYGLAGGLTDWETILPVAPWNRETNVIGGSRTSASGTPAAYVVRTDYNLAITLRLFEAELADLEALFGWAQQGPESFLWYPDADTPAQSFEVYLESPLAGESWMQARMGGYPRVSEITITLRRVDGYAWGLDFFEC